jgi:hypothetical protein
LFSAEGELAPFRISSSRATRVARVDSHLGRREQCRSARLRLRICSRESMRTVEIEPRLQLLRRLFARSLPEPIDVFFAHEIRLTESEIFPFFPIFVARGLSTIPFCFFSCLRAEGEV